MNMTKKTRFSIEIDGKILWFLLQALLVILKLCGAISGEWWVVLLPTLIPITAVSLLFITLLALCAISPSFRKMLQDAADEAEDDVDIEINGVDDEGNNTR